MMDSDGEKSPECHVDDDSQNTVDLDVSKDKSSCESANNLLGSNDSLFSIGTNHALDAAAILGLNNSEEDNEEGSINEKSSKPSDRLNESYLKSSEIDTSTLDSSGKLASTEISSEDVSTDPNYMTMKLPECTVDTSHKLTDDSTKAQPLTIIPPDGVIMVNFQPNPVTVTVDVTENDSVGAKLKLASDIARNYTKAGNVAEDLMTAEKISLDLTQDGQTIQVKQVSGQVKSPYAATNLSTSDDSGIVVETTSVTLKSSSTSRMQDVTPNNDNMSMDEDRILDDKGYNPMDTYGDIDKDTERKLLDCDNDDLDLVGKTKTKPNNRKRKTSQPDDAVKLKSKLLKKTLGLARKKTDGASNIGKKSKLPKFHNLVKSVLMKQTPAEATYSSSSKSDDTDSSLDDNDSIVLSSDETIGPKRFATIHEEE